MIVFPLIRGYHRIRIIKHVKDLQAHSNQKKVSSGEK